ncbi:MAG: hypothetical protein Kow00121_05690 [Elainellaceae cyanobacterium]
MQDLAQLRLKSKRLILRAISLDDVSEIFQEFTTEIAAYMYPKPAQQIQDTERYVRNAIYQLQNGVDLTLVILKQETLEFLGVCALLGINLETPAFGIWLKKAAHRQGFGKEAIHCLKAWADQNLEYDYLLYPVAKQNLPSRKIPISLGGYVIREFQQINLSGTLLEQVEYRIDRRSRGAAK